MQVALLQAWGGECTVADIAKRNRISERTVNRFWAEAKAEGKLPNTHRPHFPPAEAAPPGALFDRDDDLDSMTGDDDVRTDPADVAAIQAAASLTALRLAHPDLDHREAHVSPADWLKRDCDPFYAPRPIELRAMARAHDACRKAEVMA